MTEYLIDIASYQRGINLDRVKAAGFSLANVKTSQGTRYTFSDARSYASQAHARGMGVSLFHWLDGSASGRAQADYCWRTAGPIVGDVGRVAFQVDNEDTMNPATWAITRDFVLAISDRLGHLPFMYTGDWWATGGGRAQWNVASLTPWLMAAPNNGYPGSYPGDGSAQWRAGYWGYKDLSLMQYAVSGIANAGGGNISKTAIRDPHLWAALTGGAQTMADEVYGLAGNPGDGRTTPTRVVDIWAGESEIPAGGLKGYGTPTARTQRLMRIEAGVNEVRAQNAAEVVRDAAMKATVDGLIATINALTSGDGGEGSLDAAPILAAIARTKDDVREQFQQLADDLDEANTDRAAQRAEVERLTALVESTLSPAEAAAVADQA